MLSRKSFFAFAIFLSSNGALAGSVITTNLPSNVVAIVNVSGTNDGAASYSGDQGNWYQPFATDGNLLKLTLGPGTYGFGIVDGIDAKARFAGLTSTQLSTIGGAWTYNTPWATDYLVFDSSAATDATQSQLFGGAIVPKAKLPGYGNAADAYAAAKAGGYANQIVVGPNGRYLGNVATSYTLTKAQTLIFTVPDYILGDNGGIVSVVVTQAVPEPSAVAAMALAGFVLVRRRRQPSTTRS